MKLKISLLIWISFLILSSSCKEDDPVDNSTYTLTFEVDHHFNGEELSFGELAFTNEAGNTINFSSFKYLISNIVLHKADNSTHLLEGEVGFIEPKEERVSFSIAEVPNGDYNGISFMIGLDEATNNSNPNQYAPDHALHPLVSNMFWSMNGGGYIFLTMEGQYTNEEDNIGGFTYHIAFTENQMPFEFTDQAFTLDSDKTVKMEFDLAEAFKNPELFDINVNGNFSHSSDDNGIANTIRDNVGDAIKLVDYE